MHRTNSPATGPGDHSGPLGFRSPIVQTRATNDVLLKNGGGSVSAGRIFTYDTGSTSSPFSLFLRYRETRSRGADPARIVGTKFVAINQLINASLSSREDPRSAVPRSPVADFVQDSS